MMISTKGRYALRVMLDLAGHRESGYIPLAEIAARQKISEKYLSQFLKEHTGKTFAKYVEDLRVEQAKKLLKETSFSNEKIAEAAGFGSANSFYRVFKKKTGVSPGEFRGNPENCNTN